MKSTPITSALLLPLASIQATEFHVSTLGNDTNAGTQAAPLRTIQHAADLAQPGDVITVHEGVYRERINQHLLIGIEAMRLLRRAGAERLHSRKLRSFDEPAFR